MPGTMFQELVSPQSRAHGSWYTLPLSFLVHTIVLAVLVVVPLVATDVLPMPRAALLFVDSGVMPVIPTAPPAAPRRDVAAPAQAPVANATPLVAPDTIGTETGVIFEPGTIETQSMDGIVTGFGGAHNAVVETAPVPEVDSNVPVHTGGDVKPPTRTKYVAPEYPQVARINRVEGVVIIEAIIGIDGRVRNARVLKPSPFLDSAALAAVREWEYTPTLLNGRPTAVIMTVTVRFALN